MKLARIALPALLAGTVAVPAFAGSIAPTVVEPVVTPVPVPVAAGRDWTGFSGGVQLGYGAFDTDGTPDDYEEAMTYGLKTYYDYDFGNWVMGGGLQYDWSDADLGAAGDLDGIMRAGLRAGYDMGNTMVYGTGGYAKAFTSGGDIDGGDSNGYFAGIGTETFLTDNWTVGTEITYNEFTDFDADDMELKNTQFNVSLNYRF
ncbi:hypothetical protein CEW88_15135 [Alloyangia pacifica]|uniref:Outer membrane protein beta-barrel domain-containing protein n=2 Tax=Roseobacteraceae TaxID=2854170 RepID=A0A2U8HJX7_9RHOB|nr:outer membrane beta-barrel protein [Salipiger sp. PrR007]AWI85095.1 hypothetical protein CEW88_15135 [Alloyangia pacifica]NDV52060.1 porin family protein [Salipiger sp. PrR003]NDW33712.1 porin family protein [Salipiger sp. PrR007]